MTQPDNAKLIKERVNILDVIGRHTTLKRRGRGYVGCCPFHSEKTPSFHVNPDKGVYHCFGCKAGGDVIRFVMDTAGITFPEALEDLAHDYGIELRTTKPSDGRKQVLRQIYADAAEHYARQLAQSSHAKRYLEERGITPESIRVFQLGFASNQWDELWSQLRHKYAPEHLQASGLFRGEGRVYDLFRDRIIFPIRDARGIVVALGGRLVDGDGPKYINSPETPLFVKGQHLYGMDLARGIARDPVVTVVEGYTDVIQCYQAGIPAVAPMGVALTVDHAKQIKQYAKAAILCFDGDAAGVRAAKASLSVLLPQGVGTRVVSLRGPDPDDYIRQEGAKAFREHLNQAVDWFAWLMEYYRETQDFAYPKTRGFVNREVGEVLKAIPDEVERHHYAIRLAEVLEVPLRLVAPDGPPKERPSPREDVFTHLERALIFRVIHDPDYASYLDEERRNQLPNLLRAVFQDRPGVADFVGSQADLEERIQALPGLHAEIRGIAFDEHLEIGEPLIDVIFDELLRQVLCRRIQEQRRELATTQEGAAARAIAVNLGQMIEACNRLSSQKQV